MTGARGRSGPGPLWIGSFTEGGWRDDVATVAGLHPGTAEVRLVQRRSWETSGGDGPPPPSRGRLARVCPVDHVADELVRLLDALNGAGFVSLPPYAQALTPCMRCTGW